MSARGVLAAIATAATVSVSASAGAQSLESRIRTAGDGAVTFRYHARAGVCGNGRDFVRLGENTYMGTFRRGDEDRACEEGSAIVLLRMADGRVQSLRAVVGRPDAPAPAEARDLGVVPAATAVEYLLKIAGEATSTSVADGAMLGASIAEGSPHEVVTRRLFTIARDSSRARGVRRSATSWLARYAAASLDGTPGDIAQSFGRRRHGDDEESLRLHAVFVLSQQRNGAGIPALLEIASTHRDRDVRAQALFWLGQSGDSRALALFERLLRG